MLFGLGILFIPMALKKASFDMKPLALPEKVELSAPAAFLVEPSGRVAAIHQTITAERLPTRVENTAKMSPTPAWTIQLRGIDPKKVESWVAQLQARGYFAYARQDAQKKAHLFVGPEIKKERSQSILAQLHRELRLEGDVLQYMP